jgi:hypothetical protein
MTTATANKKEVKYDNKRKTNKYGVNQYTLHDPRQHFMWDLYINPQSSTFSNAYQSALKAGYTEQTSLNITTEKWFTEKLGRLSLLSKAEQCLEEALEMKVIDPTRLLNLNLKSKFWKKNEVKLCTSMKKVEPLL